MDGEREVLTWWTSSDHVAELQNMKPKQPFFFLKPPSSIVLPGEGPCLRPKGVDMHYEVELALVIGKMVRDLKPDDEQGAMDAIKGESTTQERVMNQPDTRQSFHR